MKVRKATNADVPLLSRLNVSVQELHAKGEPGYFRMPSGDDFAVPFWEMIFEHANNHVWIAEEDGRAVASREYVIGMYAFSYLPDTYPLTLEFNIRDKPCEEVLSQWFQSIP